MMGQRRRRWASIKPAFSFVLTYGVCREQVILYHSNLRPYDDCFCYTSEEKLKSNEEGQKKHKKNNVGPISEDDKKALTLNLFRSGLKQQ